MMDNNSYNLIMALASNLEALEAYHKYANDGNQQLWQELASHTEQIIGRLQQELPKVMQQGSTSGQYATSSQSNMGSSQSGMGSQSSMGSTGSQSGYGQSGTQGMSGSQSNPRY
jgi:hypothetical protein